MAGVIFGRGGSNQSAAYQPVGRTVSPDFTNQAYPPRHGLLTAPPFPADPTVSASFSVDFTAASPSLPSQMTLSRASSATYFDSSGTLQTATSNVARFDYDPGSKSPRGLLLEESRTTLVNPTQNLGANWQHRDTEVFGTGATGPDGVASTRVTEASSVFGSGMKLGTGGTGTAVRTVSIYARETGTGSKRYLTFGFDVLGGIFDLATKKCTYNPGNNFAQATDAGNGWVRCSFTGSASLPSTVYFGLSNLSDGTGWAGGGIVQYTGDTVSSLDFALPLLEDGAGPTSAILSSTGAAVTRSGDIVSSTDSTWLGYKGWVVETGQMLDATAATLLGVNTAIGLGYTSGNVLTTADGGAQSTTQTVSPYNLARGGLAWDSTPRVSISVNGSPVTTAANTPATPTTLYFGNTNNGAGGFLNGHIRMVAAYSTLSDSDLAAASVIGAPFTVAMGAVNITYNATLGALTQAVTGTVLDAATVAQTLGPLGQTAPATVSNAATVAQTLGALTQIAADTVLAQATTAQTLGALGQAATATAIDTATVVQTLGALSQAASVTSQMAITVAQNLGALVQSAAATHPDTAAVAQTLGAIVQTATGGVIDTATAAQTLGALAQAATASAPAALTAAQTLGAIGQTTTGNVIVAAVAAQTLGALAQAATGTVTDVATVAQTLGALAQTTTGGPVDTASVAQTLGALTQAATATLTDARSITAAQTLGDLGQALTGAVVDTATVSQTLGPLSQTVATTHPDTASVAQTLGAMVQAMTGTVIDMATVNQALGALNQTATASTTSGFVAAQTLGGLVQALTGTVIDAATIAQALAPLGQATTGGPVGTFAARTDTLGPLGQTTTGGPIVRANVAQALGALSQIATASVPEATFTAGQILGALGQVAASTAPERALAGQILGALGQTARAVQLPIAKVHISGSATMSAHVASGSVRVGTTAISGSLGQGSGSAISGSLKKRMLS
jgi:hypothetical protein